MMSIPRAFGWTFWRQHHVGITFLGVCLFILGALSALVPTFCSQNQAELVLGAIVVFLAVPFMAVFMMFTYGAEGADVLGRESCFPPALFRLPVKAAWLAAWPMAAGAATAAALWIAVAWFLLRPWMAHLALHGNNGPTIPLWWPALLAAAALAWTQALMWFTFGLPWLRALLFMLAFAVGALAMPTLIDRLSESALCGMLAVGALAGWGMGYLGVRRGRRGDTPDWQHLLLPAQRFLLWLFRRHGAFISAKRAQLWFEWRLGGLSLPVMTVGFVLLVLMALPLIKIYLEGAPLRERALHLVLALLSALAVPVFLAGIFGSAGGAGNNPGLKSRKAGLGPFSSALPISTTDMVAAMLKSAALSTLATWAIIAILLPLGVLLTGIWSEVEGWWRLGLDEHHPAKLVSGLMAFVALLGVWTWKRQVDRLYFSITGREWITASAALLAVAAWLALGVIAARAALNPRALVIVDAVAPWLLGPAVLCRLLAAGWALREVLRRGFVSQRMAALWLAGWLLFASLLLVTLLCTVPSALVPTHYVVFAVLFALPMARLTATPLALDWNRHR
jgi:hypothetical protein